MTQATSAMSVSITAEDEKEVRRQARVLDIGNTSRMFRRILWGDGECRPALESVRHAPPPEPGSGREYIAFSVTERDRDEIKRQMHQMDPDLNSRSKAFRHLLWAHGAAIGAGVGAGEPDPDVVRALDEISGLAGAGPEAREAWPVLSKAGYRLAAAVARRHMGELSAGRMPVVEEDAQAAELNPNVKDTWRMYSDILPAFFAAALGLAGPPKMDVRYRPMPVVDEKWVGAVSGRVLSVVETYKKDIKRVFRLTVQTEGQELKVEVPHAIGGDKIRTGMNVYAAGGFTREHRGKLRMDATCFRFARAGGFEPLYEMVERWGASDEAAAGVVARLRQLYRNDGAPEKMAAAFCRYAELSRDDPDAMWETFDGFKIPVPPYMLRSEPPGDAGLTECLMMWPEAVNLLGRAGMFPKWAATRGWPAAPRRRHGYG